MKMSNIYTDAYYKTLEFIETLKTREQLIKYYNLHLRWMASKGWVELTGGYDKRGVLNQKHTVKFHVDCMKSILSSNGINDKHD